MMAGKHIAYVEQGAIDAALGAVELLSEAGDTRGALRELEHFVAALEDKVMVPLEMVVMKEAAAGAGAFFGENAGARDDVARGRG